jgi:hypothetical protein
VITITDIVFSILPIFILRQLNRPLRDKITIGFLMGLGLLCAAAGIPKLISLQQYGVNRDFTWWAKDITMWSDIEVFTGIVAACLPSLKSVLEETMRRFGLLSTETGSRRVSYFQPNLTSGTLRGTWRQSKFSKRRKGSRTGTTRLDDEDPGEMSAEEEELVPVEYPAKAYRADVQRESITTPTSRK